MHNSISNTGKGSDVQLSLPGLPFSLLIILLALKRGSIGGLFQAILEDFVPGKNYHLPHTHQADNGVATSSCSDHSLHFILYVIPAMTILDLIAVNILSVL